MENRRNVPQFGIDAEQAQSTRHLTQVTQMKSGTADVLHLSAVKLNPSSQYEEH